MSDFSDQKIPINNRQVSHDLPEKQDSFSKEHAGSSPLFNFIKSLFGIKEAPKATKSSQKDSESEQVRKIQYEVRDLSEIELTSVKTIEHLKQTKVKLLNEFGVLGGLFVTKAIDPIIKEIDSLTQELITSDPKENDSQWYSQAISSVRFYVQFSEEDRIIEKITEQVILSVQHSVEKDLQMIQHYQEHALDGLDEVLQIEGKIAEFQTKIEELIRQLDSIRNLNPDAQDLRELFLWKTSIDDRRASITELILLTIDAYASELNRVSPKREVFDEEQEDKLEDEEVTDIFEGLDPQEAEQKKIAIGHLAFLEERALEIFDIIDHAPILDGKMIKHVFEMIEDLKNKASDFINHEATSKELKEAGSGVLRVVHQAEQSLRQRNGS